MGWVQGLQELTEQEVQFLGVLFLAHVHFLVWVHKQV